jgi:hypothetical protein
VALRRRETMTASEAKQKVLAVYPYADCIDGRFDLVWRIIQDEFVLATSVESEDAAWITAASRLPAPKPVEPAPKETVQLCENEDCDSNHICFQLKGHSGSCFREPAPKEGEKELSALFEREKNSVLSNGHTAWEYRVAPGGDGALGDEWNDKPHRLIYDLLREIDLLKNPPAQVESGDGLPPLDITDADRDIAKALKLPDDLKPDNYNMGEWIVKMTLWMGSARVARERDLKASLQREKGKDGEIVRLKGLLERACNVLTSGIVGMPEEVRREARMVVRDGRVGI